MGENSAIAWTDHTFNPWIGCQKVSAACPLFTMFLVTFATAKAVGTQKRRKTLPDAHPLAWPDGLPRTKKPGSSAFDTSQARATQLLLGEIRLLGGRYVVISSNQELRLDGLPYASRPEPSDRGVAIYFERKGKQQCFSCDRYNTVGDNIHAIGKTIQAFRGIDRWGASDVLDRTLTAFSALPPPPDPDLPQWASVLDIPSDASAEKIEAAFRKKAKTEHPDGGGTDERFKAIVDARAEALAERAHND